MTFITASVMAGLFAFLMPDKYESRMRILVRNMRADSRLAKLPVIMITSRIAQKHRDYRSEELV